MIVPVSLSGLRKSLFSKLSPHFVIWAIVLIISSNIIFSPGAVFYADTSFALNLEAIEQKFYSVWTPNLSAPIGYAEISRVMYMTPYFAFAHLFNISGEELSKILIVSELMLAGSIMYYASRVILSGIARHQTYSVTIAAFVASLIFITNPWAMSRLIQFFLPVGFAFLPLILILVIKITKNEFRFDKRFVLLIFFMSLCSTTPHTAFFSFIIVFGWLFFDVVWIPLKSFAIKYSYFFLNKISGKKIVAKLPAYYSYRTQMTKIRKNVLIGSIIISLFFVFNFYWLFPFFMASTVAYVGPPQSEWWNSVVLLSGESSIENVLRLVANWWPQTPFEDDGKFGEGVWERVSYILPILALGTIILVRKKVVFFLFIITVLAIIFAMGSQSPLAPVYNWLVSSSPFSSVGWLLREPDKFSGIIMMTYSFLIAIFTFSVLERYRRNKSIFKGIWLSLLLVLAISSFIHFYPTADGVLNKLLAPSVIPYAYSEVHNFLNNQNDDFRVMWFAPLESPIWIDGTSRFTWDTTKTFDLTFGVGSSLKPGLSIYAPLSKRYQTYTMTHLDEIGSYLRPLGVKYLVYQTDVFGSSVIESDLDRLGNLDDLVLIYSSNSLQVFEIVNTAKRISQSDNLLLLYGGIDALGRINGLPGNQVTDAVVFVEQMPIGSLKTQLLDRNNTIVKLNYVDNNDLALSLSNENYVITADQFWEQNDATTWTRLNIFDSSWDRAIVGFGYTEAITSYEGKRQLIDFMKLNGNEHDLWAWGYASSFILGTSPNEKIGAVYNAEENGIYEIWVRGKNLDVTKNNMYFVIDHKNLDTFSLENSLSWKYAGNITLGKGNHEVTLHNDRGSNLFNLVVIIPQTKMENYKELINDLNIITAFDNQVLKETIGVHQIKVIGDFDSSVLTSKLVDYAHTADFGASPWTGTHWTGQDNPVMFSTVLAGEGKAASIGSGDLSNMACIDYRTDRRASIANDGTSPTLLNMAFDYKTSDDFVIDSNGGINVNIYTEGINDEWMGDYTSSLFDRSTEWKTVHYTAALPKGVFKYSPELCVRYWMGSVWFDNIKIDAVYRNGHEEILDEGLLTTKLPIKIDMESLHTLALVHSDIEFKSRFFIVTEGDIVYQKKLGDTEFFSIELPAGNSQIVVYSTDILDSAFLYESTSISKRSGESISNQALDARIINPTRIEVQTEDGGIIKFSESYDPQWILTNNGKLVRSIPLYGSINGFITEPIDGSSTILFQPQENFISGLGISFSAMIISFVYTFLIKRRYNS